MSDTATPVQSVAPANTVADTLNKASDDIQAINKGLSDLAQARPAGSMTHFTTGPIGQDKPYSMLKAIASIRGLIPKEQAKYEWHVHNELRKTYTPTHYGRFGVNGFLIPAGIDFLVDDNQESSNLIAELRQKFYQDKQTSMDRDEMGYVKKALDSRLEGSGGPLVGFPSLGELVDMQRNLEAFSNAGASQVPLGPNGQMYYPKLISGATAYFVNENPSSALTASQPTTGSLALNAKTLAVRVPISNQLLKFNLNSAEAMVRLDMARVAALKADTAMFAGTDAAGIKGLLTYDTQSTWSSGTDKVIGLTATTTGNDGNTLNSIDLYKMKGSLPDAIGDNLTWMFRRDYFWNRIATGRAGGYAAGDGPYLMSPWRAIGDGVPARLLGDPVVLSSQVPNNRVKGSGTALTCVILGYFPDWLIGRAGVVEIDANPYGDTAWGNIQTELRMVQYIDAGPRHAASFATIDVLLTTAFTA